MDSTLQDPAARESYWHETQAELNAVRRRGDTLIVSAAAALLLLLILFRDRIHELTTWLVIAVLLLAVIAGALWFVTSRKRQIAASRGLICANCSYAPHDTEIDDVASTRHCPRCAHEL